MPKYVYKCGECSSEMEIVHRIADCDMFVIRCKKCGAIMHRVPQAVPHYNNPMDTLGDIADKKFAEWKRRAKRRK